MTSLSGKLLAEHKRANRSAANRRGYIPIRPSLQNIDNPLWLTMTPHPCKKNSFINLESIYCLIDDNIGTFRDPALDKRQGQPYALCKESTKALLEFVGLEPQVSLRFAAAQRSALVRSLSRLQSPVPAAQEAHGLTNQSTTASHIGITASNPVVAGRPTVVARSTVMPVIKIGDTSDNDNHRRARWLRQYRSPSPPSRPSAEGLLGFLAVLRARAAAVCGAIWSFLKGWVAGRERSDTRERLGCV